MNKKIKMAFEPEVVMMSVEKILPLRMMRPTEKKKKRYQRIAASIGEIGIIEPLIIYPHNGRNGQYVLLDGLLRMEILKENGEKQVPCLVAIEDDTFTYNSRLSEVTSVQEHYMIVRALERGVSKERIAATLHMEVSSITKKEKLLDGICPEAIKLLKNTPAKAGAIGLLKKVKPMRQIEIVELMAIANNFTPAYAKSLLAGTPQDQLVDAVKPKEIQGLKAEDLALMEKEMRVLGREIISIDETYSRNVLNLVLAIGYLKKLVDNTRVERYLSQHYPDILSEFQKLIEVNSLEG